MGPLMGPCAGCKVCKSDLNYRHLCERCEMIEEALEEVFGIKIFPRLHELFDDYVYLLSIGCKLGDLVE